MERLVFIVEGDCELRFVEQKIIPYLYGFVPVGHEVQMNAQKITTNRKLNRGGGNVSFTYLKNEVGRVVAQGMPWETTFLDFFRLPHDFPRFTSDSARIDSIESAIKDEIGYSRLIPYIQRHEFEALLFAATDGFDIFLTRQEKEKVDSISSCFHNVEDINGGASTAPSKRLGNIFGYDKVFHSELVWSDVSLEQIMSRAPRFKCWLESLAGVVSKF